MRKKVLGLMAVSILTSLSFAQNCSDIFISEYVEGWSNNKALEIYNPTAQTVNLSNYFVARYSNGSTSATVANAVQLSGTVAPYSVYVAVLEKLDPNGTGQEAPVWDSLQVRADGFYCPVYNTSNAFYWNGNDAILLAKGTLPASATANVTTATGFAIVDIFGKIGENPANETGISSNNDGSWSTGFPYSTGLGIQATKDHSMIRKVGIQKGVITQVSFFDPLLEWDTIPAVIVRLDANGDTLLGASGNPILDGNWASLGTHTCSCNPTNATENISSDKTWTLYPNPTTGIVYLKGVEEFDEVEVFNSLGQLVFRTNAVQKPIVSIDLSEYKGLYLLKLSDGTGRQATRKIIVK
jgi:hypothetical protein